jgi:uncharacterized membrane protein
MTELPSNDAQEIEVPTHLSHPPKLSTSEQRQYEESSLELERIIFFSDAVIAIAITLLSVQITLPQNVDVNNLSQEIFRLVPQFGIYALSFLIIGNYWVIHHRVFRNIKDYDTRLIWLNVLFLLCIAFLPVPSAVIGRFPTERSAIIFFDISLAFTGITQASIWWHASYKHQLIPKNLSPWLVRWGKIRSLIPPAVMLLSVMLSFVNTALAVWSWGLIWVGFAFMARWFRYGVAR